MHILSIFYHYLSQKCKGRDQCHFRILQYIFLPSGIGQTQFFPLKILNTHPIGPPKKVRKTKTESLCKYCDLIYVKINFMIIVKCNLKLTSKMATVRRNLEFLRTMPELPVIRQHPNLPLPSMFTQNSYQSYSIIPNQGYHQPRFLPPSCFSNNNIKDCYQHSFLHTL